jgi:extracellular matrix regulatory protein A
MMVSVGYENFVNSDFVLAIVKPDSSPLKKFRHKAEAERMLINATSGRKARSLIVMKSNHIILSALQTETLKQRINVNKSKGRLV